MEDADNLTNFNETDDCYLHYISRIYSFVMLGIFGSVLTVVGIIGNVLSLTVLSRMPVASVTFSLLKILAAVDIVYLTVYFMSVMVPEILFFNDMINDNVLVIQWAAFPIASMALTCSVWLLALVTLHRWLAISNRNGSESCFQKIPYNYQILIIIFCSVILDIPKYFEAYLEREDDILVRTNSNLLKNNVYLALYKFVLMIFIRKAIPIIITAVLTFKLVRNLNKWSQRSASCLGKEHKWESQGRVTKVLIVLAIILIICQTPSAIYPALRLFINFSYCSMMDIMYVTADLMTVLNSAINFYLFYPFVPQFSYVLKQILLMDNTDENKVTEKTQTTNFKKSITVKDSAETENGHL